MNFFQYLRLNKTRFILESIADKPKAGLDIRRPLGTFLMAIDPMASRMAELEEQGLITGYYDEARLPERNGYRRRFYAITKAGKLALEEMRKGDRSTPTP